jgi:hypothetical protein
MSVIGLFAPPFVGIYRCALSTTPDIIFNLGAKSIGKDRFAYNDSLNPVYYESLERARLCRRVSHSWLVVRAAWRGC